ncbi:magnesium and cobalt transport protein CorA [Candidatus Woesearchaeota archaeon]|nr:MAG: magnesium and cobalt transport protein CorA [Candidatus Woesearchaeota archaeon]
MLDIFYYEDGLKKGVAQDLEELKEKQIWIDATAITKEEILLLQETFDLHPVTAEDLFHVHVRIKVEEFPEYLFCVFYGIHKNKHFDLLELDFILGSNFIITNHKRDIPVFSELKKNRYRLENLFRKGNDFIFHRLIDEEVDHYFPVLDDLQDQVDDLEEDMTKRMNPLFMKKIFKIKRTIKLIKKAVLPQREKLGFIAKSDCAFLSEKSQPYFRDVYDHSIKVADLLDDAKESVNNAFEVYMSTVSNNTNEVMKVLSIIATIALPLTVISSIYGTNFANLPGGSFHYGFWLMILLMVVVSIAMLAYFKRRHWF